MTLLDLIRDLHADGKPVVDYDLFVSDNSFFDMEDVVRKEPGYEVATPIVSPPIPPQYIDLGDKPRYLYVESVKDYLRLTKAQNKIPKRFPRLLVGVFSDRDGGFMARYKGKHWKQIPPIEIFWMTGDDGTLPALDASGFFTGIISDNESAFDEPATFYTVRSVYGSEFAWMGDIKKDRLPSGLSIVNSGV